MSRRLIICADGTWNTADQTGRCKATPTNVTKMARAIKAIGDDGRSQIVYYHEGLGSDALFRRWLVGATGVGIDEHIKDCYRFLVDNYEPGDEIYLFGFSRGAYTVRSLAGLINHCGLLKSAHADRIPKAYQFYRDRDKQHSEGNFISRAYQSLRHRDRAEEQLETIEAFREKYSQHAYIKCIGVWDTVGALGIPLEGLGWLTAHKYRFHNTELSQCVEFALQALAIDEQRKAFAPTLWSEDPTAKRPAGLPACAKSTEEKPLARIEQVWFAGVHANIGGGYDDSKLSDIAFRWMCEKVRKLGLEFEDKYLAEAVEDKLDGKLYDSLSFFYRVFGQKQIRTVTQWALPRSPNRWERIKAWANSMIVEAETDIVENTQAITSSAGHDTLEYIHESVWKRYEQFKETPELVYRPSNLYELYAKYKQQQQKQSPSTVLPEIARAGNGDVRIDAIKSNLQPNRFGFDSYPSAQPQEQVANQ
jgi:uncharacterized protein (DUF2235 family)